MMANTMLNDDVRPRWSIERSGAGAASDVLRIGQRRIPLSAIVRVAGSAARERPVAGLLISASAFLIVATLFAFLVLDYGWRPRFLIATAFLTFLAVAGYQELLKLAPQNYFELTIDMRDSAPVIFASADPTEVDAFLSALRSAGVNVDAG